MQCDSLLKLYWKFYTLTTDTYNNQYCYHNFFYLYMTYIIRYVINYLFQMSYCMCSLY